jgi:hypothetical protein
MKSRIAAWLLVLIVLPVVPASAAESRSASPAAPAVAAKTEAEAARARALKEGWPDTPAGLMAGAWVEAFTNGEKAMQAFLESHIDPEKLSKRPMSERLATYRSAHDRIGTLTLVSIDESKPDELTASLLAEDATRQRFVFKVDPKAPHYMISVSTFETRHGGHGGH